VQDDGWYDGRVAFFLAGPTNIIFIRMGVAAGFSADSAGDSSLGHSVEACNNVTF
jgi:hypothetical protein